MRASLGFGALMALALSAPAWAQGEGTEGVLIQEPVSLASWIAVLPIVLPFLGGGLTMALRSKMSWQAPIALITMAGAAFSAVALNGIVAAEGPVMMAPGNWVPPFGIVIAVDQLGALLVLVTTLVGLIGLGYAHVSVDGEGVRFGFHTFYLLLIAGVCGAFSTGDLFNLYVWFEVFLLSSFGLIVHGVRPVQLDGAVKYGVLNLIATTIFLFTTGALYGVTGTLNMADIRGVLSEIEGAPVATLAALFTLAFAMKAAAFPLHIWLPASYHTPRVVAAALFAGLLTKVGVYCLMRVIVMLFGDAGAPYLTLLVWIGAATAIVAALGALAQDGLKRMAAFLVVSGVGVMLIGIGLGSQAGLSGAIVYTVHSILVMTALFLVLGVVERLSGSGRLTLPGGLYGPHGLVAALFLVFAFSAAGLPPFSGFWPKFMLVEASLATEGAIAIAAVLGVILSGFLTTIAMGRAWALVFLREPETSPIANGPADAATRALTIPLALLGIMVVGLGLFPALVVEPAQEAAAGLLDPSAYVRAVLGEP